MGVGRAALRGGRQRFRERGQVEREKHDIRDGMSFRSWMRYTVSLLMVFDDHCIEQKKNVS